MTSREIAVKIATHPTYGDFSYGFYPGDFPSWAMKERVGKSVRKESRLFGARRTGNFIEHGSGALRAERYKSFKRHVFAHDTALKLMSPYYIVFTGK